MYSLFLFCLFIRRAKLFCRIALDSPLWLDTYGAHKTEENTKRAKTYKKKLKPTTKP